MNKINLGLLTIMMLALFGCGDFWNPKEPEIKKINDKTETSEKNDDSPKKEQESKEEQETNIEKTPHRQRKLLIESQTLISQLSLGKLESSTTVIEISLMGTRTSPQFTEVFDQSYQSSWTRRYCVSESCKTCPRFVECFDEDLLGQCIHRYRERTEDLTTPLQFNKSLDELSIKIRIGQKTYSLGEVVDNQGEVLVTRFKLSKEMSFESNEILLEVTAEPNQGMVPVGFLGLGDCAGTGKPSFKSGGPTASDQVLNQEKIEYRVSVIIENLSR